MFDFYYEEIYVQIDYWPKNLWYCKAVWNVTGCVIFLNPMMTTIGIYKNIRQDTGFFGLIAFLQYS